MSCDTERKNANEADKNAIEAKNDQRLGEKELKKLNLEIVEKTRRQYAARWPWRRTVKPAPNMTQEMGGQS